ncbi:GDP-L-fucose synthetase, partial [Plasmodium cynomolgi strain B]
ITRGIFTLSTCVFPEKCTLPLTEEDIHEGRCHLSNEGYSVSKRVLEVLVRFYREKYNYQWICIIPTNVYGKYDNFNLASSHVVPSIIHKMYLAKATILLYILNTYYCKHFTIVKDEIFNVIFSTNLPSNGTHINVCSKICMYIFE